MTNVDPNTTSAASEQAASGQRPHRRRGRTLLGVAAILVSGAIIGSAATKAFSHGMFGHGMRGWHHTSMMGGSGPLDPARMEQGIERGMKHFAVEVDATPDQTQKLTAIAQAAAKDLLPYREKAQAARKQAMDLMTQTTIDRAQIEKLRAEQMGHMEVVSKRVSQAFADAAEVLTPQQRKKMAERIQERRAHWRRG